MASLRRHKTLVPHTQKETLASRTQDKGQPPPIGTHRARGILLSHRCSLAMPALLHLMLVMNFSSACVCLRHAACSHGFAACNVLALQRNSAALSKGLGSGYGKHHHQCDTV
jgi:hypothetical protein